jgi:hypothetical protein
VRFVLLLVLLAGCPRAPVPVEPPVVRGRWQESTITLQVENANPWPMRVLAVDWELAADEEPLARGRADVDDLLPSNAVTAVAIDLRLSPAQSARLAEARRENRALSVSGTLHARGEGKRGLAGDFYLASP